MSINITQLRKELRTSIRQLKPLADANAQRKFNAASEDIIEYYDEHPVTSELRAGKDSASSLVPVSEGNLFTFLGFYFNTKPASVLKTELKNHLKLKRVFDTKNASIIENGLEIQYVYPVNLPSYEEIAHDDKFNLEWSSRSWIDEIENGISGLAFYLHNIRFYGNEESHSRRAFQMKNKVREGEMPGIKYLSDVLKYARSLFS